MTIADGRVLAILLAGLDASPRQLPRSWKSVADRLVREGKARVTSSALVYRTSGDGRAEIARLQRLGVTPLPFVSPVGGAHEGRNTTTGDERKRDRSREYERRRAGGMR